MTFTTINETDADLDVFEQVSSLVPEEPEGLLVRVHGKSERGLTVIAVWRTREDADRFYADHLGPALAKVVGDPVPPPLTHIDIEDADVWTA